MNVRLKIVIIHPDIKVRDVLRRNFEDNLGAEVLETLSSSETFNLLEKNPDVSAIITLNEIGEDKVAGLLLNYLYDLNLKTPLIVIGEFEHTLKKYAIVSSVLKIEEINRLILKSLNLKKEDFEFLKLPDYIPYPVTYFYLMHSTPVELFIKLNKKSGDEFVKRFNIEDVITSEILAKYEALGLKDFYINKNDTQALMNEILKQSLTEMKKAPIEKRVEIIGKNFEISIDMMKKVGITPEAKLLADQTIIQMASDASKSDKLSELLRKLMDDSMSFSYRRSYLISLLAASLLPKLDWVNGEQQSGVLTKITMVSFYHDLFLEDETHLKILTNDEYKALENELNSANKELILNHANKAAFLLQSYPKLPSGIDLIIKQHHGMTNGVGFPEIFSSSISPLAILFIVVEDFATRILSCKNGIKISDMIEQMLLKFTQPSYKKIVIELSHLNKKPK